MMGRVSRVGDNEEDLEEAFSLFDKANNGTISAADLRHVMTNLGEKLTDEDVDDMMQYVVYSDRGDIKYRGLYTMNLNIFKTLIFDKSRQLVDYLEFGTLVFTS